jgi:hypothetical protein
VTKAKISEYSATAGDNTDVNGVNIAEGCPPSSMNNMGREIMAALKRYQVGSDGDGVTVGGNFVVSGTTALSTALPVASGGTGLATLTANNVVVGNGTSTPLFVAPGTSGNVLTSDGTTWASAAGGGVPGGSDTQVQFNNAGAFGGISGVTTDGTRMTASTTIGVGGATPSTSGSGISFPATQSASTNANTLDDYEEGTWTPTVTGGYVTSTATGVYTKIGRLVNVQFTFIFSTVPAGNSNVGVASYPFSATVTTPGVAREFTATGTIYVCHIGGAATTGAMNSFTAVQDGSSRIFETGKNYTGSITYNT